MLERKRETKEKISWMKIIYRSFGKACVEKARPKELFNRNNNNPKW
jgi:hypothetical protein